MPRELNVGLDGDGLRVAVVAARFNYVITKNLMDGAVSTLERYGVRDGDIATAWVPGSFELPVVAKALAQSGQYDAVICLGAVIRGETSHYDMVCNQAASGIAGVQSGRLWYRGGEPRDRCADHVRRFDHRES